MPKIELEPISAVEIGDEHRQEMQLEAISSAQNKSEQHFEAYEALAKEYGSSFYVNSDLFKETFPFYREDNDSRAFYECCVHNPSAVLSSAYFKNIVENRKDFKSKKVVFLTGVPGVGKSTLVNSLYADMKDEDKPAIYEIQLASNNVAQKKIEYVLSQGLDVEIVALHTKPEKAFDNVFKRFKETGRGADIGVMSNILGKLSDSMKEIYNQFGDRVSFSVYDKRGMTDGNFTEYKKLEGWQFLPLLKSEGNTDKIRENLFRHLAKKCEKGEVTQNGFMQALGKNYTVEEDGPLSSKWRQFYKDNQMEHLLPDEKKLLILQNKRMLAQNKIMLPIFGLKVAQK